MCGLLGDYLTAPKKINVNHESNRVENLLVYDCYCHRLCYRPFFESYNLI